MHTKNGGPQPACVTETLKFSVNVNSCMGTQEFNFDFLLYFPDQKL